jgi:hypothetical protein
MEKCPRSASMVQKGPTYIHTYLGPLESPGPIATLSFSLSLFLSRGLEGPH